MNLHVAIFLHVATIGRYNETLNEALSAIFSSNYYNYVTKIEINVVGTGPLRLDYINHNTTIHRRSDDIAAFEIPTICSIHKYSRKNIDAKILYLNCLGGRYVGAGYETRRTWRQMLYQYYIDDMPNCLALLTRHDACGVLWHEKPLPHFASNNWWANASYIASLIDPLAYADRVERLNLDALGSSWKEAAHKRRHSAEFWIGSGENINPVGLMKFRSIVLPKTFTSSYPWWDLHGIDWGLRARIERNREAPYERLLSSAQNVRAATRYHMKKAYDRLVTLLVRS